jgi:MFS family permease
MRGRKLERRVRMAGLGGTFRSLRGRNYRLYASGMAISAIGTWMQRIAQDWLVLDLTKGSGSALGITTALQFLPLLLFGLWGGVIADRYVKRRVIMLSQTLLGVLALILGIFALTGAVSIWHVYVLAFALGLVTLVDIPTRQSFVVELVGPADCANAIALDSATATSARIIGPAVAGVLIELVGLGSVFLINGISFAAVILGLKLIREEELHTAPRPSRTDRQLRVGLAYVRGRRDLVLILVLVGFLAAFGMDPQIATALMTKKVFHGGAGSYGLASAALAVGSLAGALFAAWRGNPTKRVLLGAAFLFGALETVAALLPTYASFAVMLLPIGVALVVFGNTAIATIQLEVTPEMRGRVTSVYTIVFAGTTPIGAPVIGWLAQTLGARLGLLTSGVISILVTAATAPLLVRQARRSTGSALDEQVVGDFGDRRPVP